MFRSAILLLVAVFPFCAFSEPEPESYDQPGIPPKEVLAQMNGGQLFASLCAMCHKKDLSGGFGPSFLDGKWKHGTSDAEILQTIKEGNLDLGMLPWKNTLTDEQIRSVVAYIREKEGEALGKSTDSPKPGPGKVGSIKKNRDSSQCTIQTDSDIVLKVIFYGADVFRILAAPEGDFADPKNDPGKAQILVSQPPCDADIAIDDGESEITFTTDKLRLTLDKKTKELVKDEHGNYVETTPDCILRLAEQYRKNNMPGGWILPNDGYGCGYVDLPEVVKGLKALGFHTGLWTERGLKNTKFEVGVAGTRLQKLDVAWTGPAYQFSLEANR